jgi:hypothetical protein
MHSLKISQEFDSKTFGLAFVKRATGMSSGLRKMRNWSLLRGLPRVARIIKNWALWRGRPDTKMKKNLLPLLA